MESTGTIESDINEFTTVAVSSTRSLVEHGSIEVIGIAIQDASDCDQVSMR